MVRSQNNSLKELLQNSLVNLLRNLFSNFLYIILLISILLNGYFIARLQSSGQSVFLGLGQNSTLGQIAQEGSAPPPDGSAPQAPQQRENVKVDKGTLPALGDQNAKVTIVEFSDFQCPFCRSFFTAAFPELKKEYIDTGKVALYYRHFPLDFHPSANISAQASECANEQGKFWQMHDKMYDEQGKQGTGTIQYTKDDLKKWAADLGLNTGSFNECLDSEKYKDKVAKDLTDGTAAGVSGTPTFFVNGTELVGAQPFSAFKAVIDQKLNQ